MKLLDTTFLVHYWRGLDAAAEYLAENEDEQLVTTTLNVKELAVGRALQGALEPTELRTTFDWLAVLPFDLDHAFVAGELEADLRRRDDVEGTKLNALAGDLLIAAVAEEEGAAVVTRNVEDFELIGVAVESY